MSNSIAGFWKIKKKKLIKKYPSITDNDLNYQEGKEKEMMDIIGFKLGKSNQELLNIIIAL